MIRLQARPQPSKLMSLLSPLLALAVTVLIGVLLFVLLGKDPLRGLQMFFIEPLKSLYALSELSVKATPLILIALGLALCYRSNTPPATRARPTLRTYDSRTYEGAYLAGVIAGRMTKADVLGVVGSIPIPEVVRNIRPSGAGEKRPAPGTARRPAAGSRTAAGSRC